MTHLCGSASCSSPSTCGRTPRSTREPGGTPRAEGRKEVAMSQRKVTRHRFLKRSGARLLRHWLVLFAAAFLIIGLTACSNFSYNLAVESVNQYSSGFGPGSDLSNSIANGDGFILGMTQPAGSPWVLDQRWTDANVYDTDFVDPEKAGSANFDSSYFDKPKLAISYFTGHGTCSGCSQNTPCSSTQQCTNPNANAGETLPG